MAAVEISTRCASSVGVVGPRLIAFLALTFFFPKKSREDVHGTAVRETVG